MEIDVTERSVKAGKERGVRRFLSCVSLFVIAIQLFAQSHSKLYLYKGIRQCT